MTNEEIITEIAIELYGEDAVNEMIDNDIEIPLHTLKGWEARGPYRVKKGEHGIETRLWKKKKKKKKDKNDDTEDDDEKKNREFYLVKSYLFTKNQVEKTE